MDKRIGLEGSGASKLVQLMRKHGRNKDVTIDIGEVISASPLSVNVDGLELDAEDLILSETVSAKGLTAGDKLIVIGDEDFQQYFVIDRAVM